MLQATPLRERAADMYSSGVNDKCRRIILLLFSKEFCEVALGHRSPPRGSHVPG